MEDKCTFGPESNFIVGGAFVFCGTLMIRRWSICLQRGTFGRSNYCRSSINFTGHFLGAANVVGANVVGAKVGGVSVEEANIGGAIVVGATVGGASVGGAFEVVANDAEQLALFAEHLSPERSSPEYVSGYRKMTWHDDSPYSLSSWFFEPLPLWLEQVKTCTRAYPNSQQPPPRWHQRQSDPERHYPEPCWESRPETWMLRQAAGQTPQRTQYLMKTQLATMINYPTEGISGFISHISWQFRMM